MAQSSAACTLPWSNNCFDSPDRRWISSRVAASDDVPVCGAAIGTAQVVWTDGLRRRELLRQSEEQIAEVSRLMFCLI
eukprot:30774-Eustigmatos_ZCMA.PRE.1